jgi:membrane-bound serine protease (ClpP class)
MLPQMNQRPQLRFGAWRWVVIVAAALLCATGAGSDTGSSPGSQAATPRSADSDSAPLIDELSPDRVVIVPIEGTISNVTYHSIKRRVEEAVEEGADLIVFEMDTPGGAVIAALDICTFIKNMKVDRMAWVNPDAYSAGAMIAIACPQIVMAPRSRIGDAAPIMISPQGAEPLPATERSKIESPVLEEFRESAQRHGYPEALCEAMVRLSPAIYMIVNEQTVVSRFVFEDELDQYGLSPDDLPIEGVRDTDDDEDESTSLLDRLRRLGGGAGDDAESDWAIVKKVLDENQLLTLNQDEAVEYGFAVEKVSSDRELAEFLNTDLQNIRRAQTTLSERVTSWLTSPGVMGILFMLFLLGAYMEMQTPGLGLAGGVAVVCLAIVLGAPMLAGLANWVEIGIIIVGFALLMVEVFITPGFGVPGFLGLMLIFGGMVLTFVPEEPGPNFIPRLPQTWTALRTGLMTMSISILMSFVGFYFITRYFGRLPILNRLILGDEQHAANQPALAGAPQAAEPGGADSLRIGEVGEVVAGLHPIGRAQFRQNQIADVVSHGGWIEAGNKVRIVEIHGNRIVVEEA